VKFSVLALDFDGTIAESGSVSADLDAALAEVRERGIMVVLTTGRRLEDLRDVAGNLSFADALVAENGAVIAFPRGPPRVLSREPSAAFLHALERAGIAFRTGRCVVEADAGDAGRILSIIRSLELPLALTFNRGRVMALPTGVCKSAGLLEVLHAFRLSPHNALAIGDAENDHDFLAACEYGAAVEWGSEALKRAADGIVPGTGPSGVAPYLRRAIESMRLPDAQVARRRVTLGRTREGRPVSLAVRGRNLLVAGDPRSGKSWAMGLACEQLVLLGYSLCIIDPEGDYASLDSLPGVLTVGAGAALPPPKEITRLLRHPDLSVVVDLSRVEHAAKMEYLRTLLSDLVRFRGKSGLPHRIVVDEAHYFLGRPDATEFFDVELGGYALVTYRVSDLHPPILASMQAVVMTHTSNPREVATLGALAGREGDPAWPKLLGDLAIDEAALVRATAAEGAQLERFRLSPRVTAHVRHRAKYRDVPLRMDRAFVFTQGGKPSGAPARTLRAFVEGISRAPADAVDAHARRGDFSRWIADVFGDRELALEVRELEELDRRGEVVDLVTALVESVSLRYEVGISGSTEA
jgi:hydroxymethylpyrimidine pyrophosphatase-like HAD family hydrolase